MASLEQSRQAEYDAWRLCSGWARTLAEIIR